MSQKPIVMALLVAINSVTIFIGGIGQLSTAPILGIVAFLLGLLTFATAWGLYSGQFWAWGAGMVLSALVLIVSGIMRATGALPFDISLVLSALSILLLFLPTTQKQFGR